MLKIFASLSGAIIIAFAFYSALRVLSITVFDVLALIYSFIMLLIFYRKFRYPELLEVPFWIFILILTSSLVSLVFANESTDHVAKCAVLIIGFWDMFLLAYVVVVSGYFSKHIILNIMCISGTISSVFIILQGQFGLFTSLLIDNEIELWSRFPGLAEHPVEAGLIGAYTGFLALVNTLDARSVLRKIFWAVALMITLYSMKFSGSFTGMLSLAGATCAMLVVRRAWWVLAVFAVMLVLLGPIVANPDFLGDSFMHERLTNLLVYGENYETVQSRLQQFHAAIAMMSSNPLSFLFGLGYSEKDLPMFLDIHNGLLAAYFHFGILGFIAQVLTLLYISHAALIEKDRADRSVFIGIFLIFICAYMTGPAFFRRSIWMLPIISAMFIRAQSMRRADISRPYAASPFAGNPILDRPSSSPLSR
jgi:hypothetical protein